MATDQHLRDKALQFFLDQAERVRVVLRVIDKSDLDGATFLADLSGHVLCLNSQMQISRLPHIYDMNSAR